MAEALVSTVGGRRSVTEPTTVAFEHIPAELLAHQVRGVAACDALPMIDCALREGYDLDADLPRNRTGRWMRRARPHTAAGDVT